MLLAVDGDLDRERFAQQRFGLFRAALTAVVDGQLCAQGRARRMYGRQGFPRFRQCLGQQGFRFGGTPGRVQ